MKLYVTKQGLSVISITDFLGRRMIVGSYVIAPLEDHLQVGVVVAINSAPGTVTIEIHGETLTQPIVKTYLFPSTQVLSVKCNDLSELLKSRLFVRSIEIRPDVKGMPVTLPIEEDKNV